MSGACERGADPMLRTGSQDPLAKKSFNPLRLPLNPASIPRLASATDWTVHWQVEKTSNI